MTIAETQTLDVYGQPLQGEDAKLVRDIIVFPDMICYKRIHIQTAKQIIQHLIDTDTQQMKQTSQQVQATQNSDESNTTNTLDDSVGTDMSSQDSMSLPCSVVPYERCFDMYYLICCHRLRDKRCGIAGNMLADEMEKYIQAKQIPHIQVLRVSHVGGHKWAGKQQRHYDALLRLYGLSHTAFVLISTIWFSYLSLCVWVLSIENSVCCFYNQVM